MAKTITRSVSAEHANLVTQREFEAMTRMRAALTPDLLATVPEPLFCLPNNYTLVMSKLPGRPMTSVLKRRANPLTAWRWREQADLVHEAGQWLRRFQDATQGPSVPLNQAQFLEGLERQVSRALAHGWLSTEADNARLAGERAARAVGEALLHHAARQGDFTPQNVLVEGRHLGVVDWENYSDHAPVHEDVATFLSYLRGLAHSPFYSRRAIGRMVAAFEDGYGGPDRGGIRGLFELRILVGMLAEQLVRPATLIRATRIRGLRRDIELMARSLAHAPLGEPTQ